MTSSCSTSWSSPANIALVKYWGKHGDQLPQNPSISMTLSESITTTVVAWIKAVGDPVHTFLFEGRKEPVFEKRVLEYLNKILCLLPDLVDYSLNISSKNSFPHSSGISSSASFMSSLALCLIRAEEEISGITLSPTEFYRKASFLARLGSGSAARSVYGGYTIWGASPFVIGSSDEYAVPIDHHVHPVFKTYRDAVLVISSRSKSLSSSAGHRLMESNAFASARFTSARENAGSIIRILSSGDQENFIRLVEEEAMTLHGLIQASAGGPILMEPGTIAIIRLIRDYRKQTGSHLCFTLDAGPNVHLLYPTNETQFIRSFIETELLKYCENGRWIDDRIGEGPKEFNTASGGPGLHRDDNSLRRHSLNFPRQSCHPGEGRDPLTLHECPKAGTSSCYSESFPAKLLLFGEYSVLVGSDACAFPLEQFSGRLVLPDLKDDSTGSLVASNHSIKRLLTYLTEPDNQKIASPILDLDRLAIDIGAGLAFDSDIPQNYGSGSSGALVAAIYHAYRKEDNSKDIQSLRAHLAFIESAFHSKSSGTDPLVSYLRKPVFILKEEISCPDLSLEDLRQHVSIELIDSGIPGATKSGVGAFQSEFFQTPAKENLFDKEYIPLINTIVGDIYSSKFNSLMDRILSVSEMQLQLFPNLFTPDIRLEAQRGIDSRDYAIKLCGSGGGGFYLKIKENK